jgi:hypothetical protein
MPNDDKSSGDECSAQPVEEKRARLCMRFAYKGAARLTSLSSLQM